LLRCSCRWTGGRAPKKSRWNFWNEEISEVKREGLCAARAAAQEFTYDGLAAAWPYRKGAKKGAGYSGRINSIPKRMASTML
jgi:hypothetical protein